MANKVTLLRFPLLIAVIFLLYLGGVGGKLIAVPAILLLILMDTFDGIIARSRNETSLLGSVLDIAADRAVEIILWVCFADLGLIPVAIPIIVILRGVTVDALRSLSVSSGKTPFGMMQSKWGRRLVVSKPMRTGYAVAKGVAFCGLALAHGLQTPLMGTPHEFLWRAVWIFSSAVSWIAVVLCLMRGIPVFIEARAFLHESKGGA